MNVKAFSLNEIGGRKNVEDDIMPKKYTPQQPKLFIVCDGVGGSSFGEVASELATKSYYEIFEKAVINTENDFRQTLNHALTLFQKRVLEFVDDNPSASSTSTTLTLLAIQQGKAYTAWCGDSKIFQLRNGSPVFKSRDHSLVAELTAQGVITAEEAETHPQRNIITRSLNSHTKQTDVEITVLTDIQNEDWFLLCTDGLMEQFTESLFPVMLNKFDAGTDYSKVIDKICYGKTKDNYSMYLLHLTQVKQAGSSKKLLLTFLVVLILAIGGWFAYSQMSAKEEQPATTTIPDKKDTVHSIMMVRPQEEDTTNKKDTTTKKDPIKK
jgi:serine/threonine protein phosphatase PrpC